jgi:nucleoid-associated protein YgaU
VPKRPHRPSSAPADPAAEPTMPVVHGVPDAGVAALLATEAPRTTRAESRDAAEIKVLRAEVRSLRDDQDRLERVLEDCQRMELRWRTATIVVSVVASVALAGVLLSMPTVLSPKQAREATMRLELQSGYEHRTEDITGKTPTPEPRNGAPLPRAEIPPVVVAAPPPEPVAPEPAPPAPAEGTTTDRPAPSGGGVAEGVSPSAPGARTSDSSAAVAKPPKGRKKRPASYTVEAGDTLGSVALRFYGKASAAARIRKANARVLKGSDTLRPGTELVLP